jgi:adenylylsulfate kinase
MQYLFKNQQMNTGCTIWLTGYSGSGKSTISVELQKKLILKGLRSEILDGDVIRQNLSKGLTFTKEDRMENIRRIGFVAEILSRHNIFVIVSAISPYREVRDEIRSKIKNFIEVFVKCSIQECSRRDPKGLYKKAINGQISNFTGISDPYEEPVNPEVVCETEFESPEESVDKLIQILYSLKLID